jgi:hypothetical protein
MAKQSHLERHWCSEIVSIARRGKNGLVQWIAGNLEEIGERTLVVLTEGPIPVGTWVRIRCQQCELSGIAEARSYNRQLGFSIKVRLAPESRWTLSLFKPDHLFTLPEVLSHGRQLRHSA